MGFVKRMLQVVFGLQLVINFLTFKAKQFLLRILPHEKKAVTIGQGTIVGLQQKTRLSKKPYFSFLGVPYAKPPINDLRFMPPVKHPGWSGREFKAFSEGNKCPQYPLRFNKRECGEDCLYLNIHVPLQEEFNDKKAAVMVFIHGGAFIFGSGTIFQYSPDYLLDENVIVVTINYRLGVFGFLNFDIDECPGNMGLKDQRLAMEWIKENISAFGGDAQNITIFGESSGAACVHCHTLSPKSTGLFQKAIMQSGNMFDSWALNTNHREDAFKLAKNLGCKFDDPKEIVRYLKTVPAIDLLKCSNLEINRSNFLEYPFVPSIECDAISDPVLPAHPEVLNKTALPVPIITGLNDMEGIIILGGTILDSEMKKLDFLKPERMENFLKNQYSEENVAKIKKFYFDGCDLDLEAIALENIVDLLSDMYFVKNFHHSFEPFLKRNVTPVYNYEFKFDSNMNGIKKILMKMNTTLPRCIRGACHADELNFLFYMAVLGFTPKPNSPEYRMCRTFSKLWANFAKTGNPNSPDLSFEWKNTSEDNPKYLSIDGDSTKMMDGLLYGSRVKFWDDISKTVCSE